MPLIGFTVFKDKILDGSKRQTIRKRRKHPIKIFDRLYLYWHLRQKDCVKLGEATCLDEFLIQIHSEYWAGKQRPLLQIYNKNSKVWTELTPEETLEIAHSDGFQGEDGFLDWFIRHYGSGETFQVIRWGELKK